MDQVVSMQSHAPVGYMDVLGCEGYQNAANIICMTASGDNHFLSDGIVEGSVLFIDPDSEYQKGNLNVYQYRTKREPQYKLSRKKVPWATFVGKVVMAVNQY